MRSRGTSEIHPRLALVGAGVRDALRRARRVHLAGHPPARARGEADWPEWFTSASRSPRRERRASSSTASRQLPRPHLPSGPAESLRVRTTPAAMTAAKSSNPKRRRPATSTSDGTSGTNSFWGKHIRLDRERAAEFLAKAPTCPECGTRIATRGMKRHAMCEPGALAGRVCSCVPGCTTGDIWGDGPRDCDPSCVPCHLMAGKPLPKR